MKILDFMNEAWLRGRYSQGSPEEIQALINLQKFAGNLGAEVQSYSSGLLVADLKPEVGNVGGAHYFSKKGQLYYVGANEIIPLTGVEYEGFIDLLIGKLISCEKYSGARKNLDRFKQDYQNGVFKSDEPESN